MVGKTDLDEGKVTTLSEFLHDIFTDEPTKLLLMDDKERKVELLAVFASSLLFETFDQSICTNTSGIYNFIGFYEKSLVEPIRNEKRKYLKKINLF